jgi:hypothetical protein
MKDIRIFIASSRELVRERNALAFLVLAKEEEFAARGLRVRLAKWEYVDPKMTEARTEDRYLDEMYDCDAALVLYYTNCRTFGPEQMKEAYDRTKREENPKRLYVFFRDADDTRLDPSFAENTLTTSSHGHAATTQSV